MVYHLAAPKQNWQINLNDRFNSLSRLIVGLLLLLLLNLRNKRMPKRMITAETTAPTLTMITVPELLFFPAKYNFLRV